ncbi:hypothetical protein V8E54_005379 [Elaphomyces granulatus]
MLLPGTNGQGRNQNWDTLDMNFLRTLPIFDLSFKQRILDLSQGIDRETDTRPSGMHTRGGLSGLESLSLQGLPLDHLMP